MIDGKLFVAGGGGRSSGDAIASVGVFDPAAQQGVHWTDLPNMNVSRWYPSVVTLASGDLAVAGGATNLPEFCDQGSCSGSGITCTMSSECQPICQGGTCSHNVNPCVVDTDCRPPGAATRTVDIYDPTTQVWTSLAPSPMELSDNYPALMVLPDRNVVYAGSEVAEGLGLNAYVLDMSADPPVWFTQAQFEATPAAALGGAAVMYAPGKIMRAGGRANPLRATETLDLSGDYLTTQPNWKAAGDMCDRRHLHSMVLLPTGDVLAAGGNRFGNSQGEAYEDYDGSCAAAQVTCNTHADCSAFPLGPNPGQCIAAGVNPGDKVCDPGNNACFAVKTIEIWDPDTKIWSKAVHPMTGAEILLQEERMYHHTSLLMPEGEVVIMGGGGRTGLQDHHSREVIAPPYLLGGAPRPVVLDLPNETAFTYADCGQSMITVELDPGAPAPDRVTLVRLGAVTHQNDMGQRFIELCNEGDLEPCIYQAADDLLQIPAPCSAANDRFADGIAPPGYYMLFVLSDQEVPSIAEYVYVGPPAMGGFHKWFCDAQQPPLTVQETSCMIDPNGSQGCPGHYTVETNVPVPQVGGDTGWEVLTYPGELEGSPTAPTSGDLALILDRCIEACELHWSDRPEVSAGCSTSGAFSAPTYVASTETMPYDFIDANAENGQGLFAGQSLSCELTESCCSEFDEHICWTKNARVTPQADGLGVAPEYVVPLRPDAPFTPASKLKLTTNVGSYSKPLSGELSFSFCTDGSNVECPFYLADFTASTSASLVFSMIIDGQSRQFTLDNFAVRLVQPAFGIRPGPGSIDVGFPVGSLFIETEFDVDGKHVVYRAPNQEPVYAWAKTGSFGASVLPVTVSVPIDGEDVLVSASINLDTAPKLDSPPTVSIGVPSSVRCDTPFTLAYSASDPDSDLAGVRWRVNGALLAPNTTTLSISGPRLLSITATDARGASTTASKQVTCT